MTPTGPTRVAATVVADGLATVDGAGAHRLPA